MFEETPDYESLDEAYGDPEFLSVLEKEVAKTKSDVAQDVRKVVAPRKGGGRPLTSPRELFQGNLQKNGYMMRKIRTKRNRGD